MKKIVLIALSVLVLSSCGKKNQFSISGNIVPAKDGKVILFGFKDGQPVPADTADMKGGKFKFSGESVIPELKLIGLEGQENFIGQLFVEEGKIDMTIYPDSFQNNVIKGSASQDIFKIYVDEMVGFQKKETELQQRFGQAQGSGNAEELNAIRFEYQTMMENTQLYSKNFVAKYNTSPVAAYVYLMTFVQNADVEELDSILKVFEPIKTSEFVAAIQERADVLRLTSKGSLAPDFTLAGPDGTPVSLSSYKGKYVLIDFWASWCKPCMEELPNVIDAYNTYKDKGFEIVGVSLDRDQDAWLKTIKDMKMNWVHVWDMAENAPGQVATKYNVSGIPHTVLIDREGKIVDTNLRGAQLKMKLAELLK